MVTIVTARRSLGCRICPFRTSPNWNARVVRYWAGVRPWRADWRLVCGSAAWRMTARTSSPRMAAQIDGVVSGFLESSGTPGAVVGLWIPERGSLVKTLGGRCRDRGRAGRAGHLPHCQQHQDLRGDAPVAIGGRGADRARYAHQRVRFRFSPDRDAGAASGDDLGHFQLYRG